MVAESDRFVKSGVFAHNEYKFDDAGLFFWRAFSCLDRMPSGKERRDRTRALPELLLKGGYEDLCLLVWREIICLDEALGDEKLLASDLISYANVHQNLGNKEEAKATSREVIDRCLAAGDYANAASATTNLAGLLADDGNGKEAITLLKNSLSYLSKKPFPGTEFMTHVVLIQVVEAHDGDPVLAVKSGIEITNRFQDRLTERFRKALGPPLLKAVEAYLKKEPQPDPDAWKKQNLPWITSRWPARDDKEH